MVMIMVMSMSMCVLYMSIRMFMVFVLYLGMIMTLFGILTMVMVVTMVLVVTMVVVVTMVLCCWSVRSRTDSSTLKAALCGNLFMVWMMRMIMLMSMTRPTAFHIWRMSVKPFLHIQ